MLDYSYKSGSNFEEMEDKELAEQKSHRNSTQEKIHNKENYQKLL